VSLRPIVRERFLDYTSPLEGVIRSMYQDAIGKITIAVGCLIDPIELALALPLRWPDGRIATRAEIAAEWTRVKETPGLAEKGWRAAAEVSPLRLSPEDVERLTWQRLDQMVPLLERRFPQMPSWPASAQLAVVSLSWACGTSFAYPKLEEHLLAGDFLAAAEECAIRGNPPRSAAQRSLLLAAADGGNPDELALPWEAPGPHPALPEVDRAELAALVFTTLEQSTADLLVSDRDAYYRDRAD
jgi:GH24 family phage-related lysozyme (muramidase)